MSDIRKHPAATGQWVCFRRRRKRRAAVGTVPCSYFILGRTATAFFREFATWHRNEISPLSLDDLQVSDNECLINRDGAKCAQSIIYVRNKLDSNLCDYHLTYLTESQTLPNSLLNSALSKKPFHTRLNQATLCRGVLRLSTRSNGSLIRERPYGRQYKNSWYLGECRGVQPRCLILKNPFSSAISNSTTNLFVESVIRDAS